MSAIARDTQEYRRRWWTLLVISVSVLIIVIDATIVNVALPTLQRELNTTGAELQWIINSYIMIFGALMLTTGALGDRLGRKRMLQAGIVVFGGASLGAAFATSGVSLIIWRVIMGIGGAMILPATLAIITNVFPREERGRAIGAWAGMNAVGIALGPIVGGLLIENFSWNSIFFLNIPIAVVALAAGIFLIPNSRDPNPKRPDYPGTLLSAAGLAALVFGLVQGSDWGWTHPAVIGALAGAVVLVAVFLLWERHSRQPMLELAFFRRRRFSMGVGAVSLMAFGQVGITFGLTLYMQFVNGYTALETGLRFVPLALGIFLGAGSADRVVARLGTKTVMFLGFIINAALLVLAAFWQTDTAYWQLGLMFFGIGFALGYVAAPATDAVMGALPEARAGIGSAMNTVCRMVAGAIGVAVIGSILGTVYSASFRDAVAAVGALPAPVIEAASDSVGAAIIVAQQLPGAAGEALAQVARTSFMDGWLVMAFCSGGISFVAAVFTLIYMPQRHAPPEEITAAGSGETAF
jgi:EmrB/QacA subfamily drug resistance transporter